MLLLYTPLCACGTRWFALTERNLLGLCSAGQVQLTCVQARVAVFVAVMRLASWNCNSWVDFSAECSAALSVVPDSSSAFRSDSGDRGLRRVAVPVDNRVA